MAGKQHYLPLSTSPRLSECSGSYFGNLAVYNRGELIHDCMFWTLTGQTCQPCPELLAVAEHVERTQPRGNVAKPYG